jgi:hypothetical protein
VWRGEKRPHLRDVRLDGISQGESICRCKVDFADEQVTGAVVIDPFDGLVGGSCCAWCWPTEFGDHLSELRELRGVVVSNENLHLVWLLR